MAPPLLPTDPLVATVPEAAVVPVVAPLVAPMPTVPLPPTPAVVPAAPVRVPLAAVPVVPTPLTEPDDAPVPLLPPSRLEPAIPEYDPPPQSISDTGTAATSGANHMNQPCFIFTGSPK
jgi:hypothetical protein